MRTSLSLAAAAAAALAAFLAPAYAQNAEGPGGYDYHYLSPSIVRIVPPGWTEAKTAKPDVATKIDENVAGVERPVLASDLFDDPAISGNTSLQAAIGQPRDNALGPLLAREAVADRARRLSEGKPPIRQPVETASGAPAGPSGASPYDQTMGVAEPEIVTASSQPSPATNTPPLDFRATAALPGEGAPVLATPGNGGPAGPAIMPPPTRGTDVQRGPFDPGMLRN